MPDFDPRAVVLCETCQKAIALLEANAEPESLLDYLCNPCKRRVKHALNAVKKNPDEDGFRSLK